MEKTEPSLTNPSEQRVNHLRRIAKKHGFEAGKPWRMDTLASEKD